MDITPQKKQQLRNRRHNRIRKTIKGTSDRPRLVVFRSINGIYGQIINDVDGKTLVSASAMKIKKGTLKDQAREVGTKIGADAVKKGITEICFDRNGYKYHGKIKEFAEGAREAGLKF